MADIDDNGILASIPGQFVSAAIDQLPDAETVAPANGRMETELDVPGIGRVRFKARQMVSKGKSRYWYWYWSVERAVLIST